MTASEMAKSLGLVSLKEVAEITGKSTSTLNDWHRNEKQLFKAIIVGCASIKRTPALNKIIDGAE